MTCSEFTRHVDRFLAGDLSDPILLALGRHVEGCPTCGEAWTRARTLRTLLVAVRDDALDPAAVERARRGLRASFGRAGHPPVCFGSLKTPVGRLFVGMTDNGVCDVTFGQTSERRYRQRLQERSPEVRRDDAALSGVIDQLAAYFAGTLTRFSLPIDLRGVTPFTARVLHETRKLGFGQVTSYGELAARLGSPGASRAVGGALGRNPVPIIIPCHRVLARGGRLGGFTGGVPTKRILLGLEGRQIADSR